MHTIIVIATPITLHHRLKVVTMAAASLSELEIDDQPFSLYLLTQQNGDSLELRAFDGTDSWVGNLSGGNLAEMARKVWKDALHAT